MICCDGSSGVASSALGLSDECITHSSGIYGSVASIERNNKTLVPTPEKRVHNLSFDLSAYNANAFDENEDSHFTLKIFGNSKCRHLALAINKCDSHIFRSLKTVLDKSVCISLFPFMVCPHRRSDQLDQVIGYRCSSVCKRNRGWSGRSTLVGITRYIVIRTCTSSIRN